MTVELIDEGGRRIRIPRGWVVLTVAFAGWGAIALVWLAVSGLLGMFS